MALKSSLRGAALMLGLLVCSSPLFAQQPEAPGAEAMRDDTRRPRHRGKGGDIHMLRLLRELDLTEAQQQQVRIIFENHIAATKPQRDELMQLREQREQGASGDDLSSRVKALREQIHESSKNARTQVLSILTPDQRLKIDQMETEFRARREQRRERRRGRQENDQQQ